MTVNAPVLLQQCVCGNLPTALWGKLRVRDGSRCLGTDSCRESQALTDKLNHENLILAIRLRRQNAEKIEADRKAAEQARIERKRAKDKRTALNKLARADQNRAVSSGSNLKATRKMSGK